MRKKLILIGSLVLLLAVIGAVAFLAPKKQSAKAAPTCLSLSPNGSLFPSVRTYTRGNIFYDDGRVTDWNKELDFWLSHYQIIGQPFRIDYIVQNRCPYTEITLYETYREIACPINPIHCGSYNMLKQKSEQLGYTDFEDMFLHFNENTTLTIGGITRTIPGYDTLPVDQKQKSRVPLEWGNDSSDTQFYPNGRYWYVDPASSHYKDAKAQVLNTIFHDNLAYDAQYPNVKANDIDGVLIDNAGYSVYEAGLAPGEILSGGHLREYGGKLISDNTRDISGKNLKDYFYGDVATDAQYIRDYVLANSGRTFRLGFLANAGPTAYFYDALYAGFDGFNREYAFESSTEDGMVIGMVNQSYAAADRGKLTNIHISDRSDLFGADTNRDKINALANYFLAKTPYTAMAYGYRTWSGHWFKAIEYDIGQPKIGIGKTTDKYYILYQAADPSGSRHVQAHMYAREFDKALILSIPKPDWDSTYTASYGPINLPSYDKGGGQTSNRYQKLKSDGTLDPNIITSITLRNAEGAILVKTDVAQGLSLTKSATINGQPATQAKSGDIITYTINYTNGTQQSNNAKIEDPIPANASYVTNSAKINGVPKTDASDGDGYTLVSGLPTFNLGTLSAGATGAVRFQVTVN